MRGVIFDMDGVLVLSEPFIAEAAIRMFAEKGYTIGEDEFRPFIGMGEDRFIGGVAEKYDIPLVMPRGKEQVYKIYLDIIRDLKHRGFSFVGSTVIYAHMQAVGMVNDHVVDCYRYRDVRRLRTPT